MRELTDEERCTARLTSRSTRYGFRGWALFDKIPDTDRCPYAAKHAGLCGLHLNHALNVCHGRVNA